MKKRLLILLAIFMLLPVGVNADSVYRMELVVKDKEYKPGDTITVNYGLTYAMEGVGITFDSVENVIFFDANVLYQTDEFDLKVRDNWIEKSVSYDGVTGCQKSEFNAKNNNAIIGESDIKNGIATIATYTFKISDDATSQTTKIYAIDGDGYATSIEIKIAGKSSGMKDEIIVDEDAEAEEDTTVDKNENASDESINEDKNTNNGASVDKKNNNIMNYVIVTLLSSIMVLLIILICVMVSKNKKRNY